jgi:tRNA pseudouridine38-40 synthase
MAGGVLLEVAYDGTAFHGWAAQAGARTVEETLRGAVLAIDPRAAGVRGASRTDAGVHAEGQLAAFDTEREIPARGWVLGLNQHLPEDVAVRAARAVPEGFSPRFASLGKRYRYRVLVDPVRDPHLRARAWRLSGPIDVERLAREARAIEGTHDFAAFRSSGDERQNTVRTMRCVAIEAPPGGRMVSIAIEGDAFLYNMVRILVGTLMDVARGRLEEGTVARAIAAKDRRLAGTTAPAQGLTLEEAMVELPEGTGERWPR